MCAVLMDYQHSLFHLTSKLEKNNLKTFGEAMLPEDCEVLPEVFLADKRCCCY